MVTTRMHALAQSVGRFSRMSVDDMSMNERSAVLQKKKEEVNFHNSFSILPNQVMYLMGTHISHRDRLFQAADTVKWCHISPMIMRRCG